MLVEVVGSECCVVVEMQRGTPVSKLSSSSAASDVYKKQVKNRTYD